MSKRETIKTRQGKIKEAFLEHLKRAPTIESACQKATVSRATVYRWMKQSKKFAKEVEENLAEGRLFISDIAEAQIFSLIGEKKIEAIKYWLKHHHPAYKEKLQIEGTINTIQELSEEQKELVQKALELANLNLEDNESKK